MNPRVKKVKYKSPYKLLITFSNGEIKEFDFSSYLNYPVFMVLRNEAFCQKAKVLNGTVIFDEETDFDPDTLYLESKSLTAV
ncbi:MAG: DUF2442 domain-containing protein [Bacteroidetes bacterium]|nr:DUF2442 domain-containing protein [Bacteroidota bacterium]MBS1632012.1 DUF2442 domain-containing protein [Bacteroidota bacterium]